MKPYLKKFLKESGLTTDEALKFLEKEMKERGLDKTPGVDDEFMNKLSIKASEWKKQVIEDMSFDELRMECKRRGIL